MQRGIHLHKCSKVQSNRILVRYASKYFFLRQQDCNGQEGLCMCKRQAEARRQKLGMRGMFAGSTILVARRFSSSAKDYLLKQGYKEDVAKGILDAFLPNKPTVAEIKGLGESGLKSLSEAVEHELKTKNYSTTPITINIKVPHQSTEFSVMAPIGYTFYQLAKRDPDVGQYLECACSGNAACSTCHVIVQEDYFKKLPEPQEDELDMLDLAAGLTDTSRLGCQIKFTKQLDGLTVTIPSAVNNLFK